VKVLNDARLLSADSRTVLEWDMTKILNCVPEILRVDFLGFFLLVNFFQLVDCSPKSRSSLHVRARTNVSISKL
jgi:hypothetical protein